MVLKKTPKSPLDCKIKPVDSKENQSWIFTGRTNAEALILWPLDAKNWLIRKDSDAAKDWRQKEKGTTEDEMVGWYHWLDRQEFEQAPEVGDGQGSLVCCSAWVTKSQTQLSDWTELNWVSATELDYGIQKWTKQVKIPAVLDKWEKNSLQ